LSDSNSVSDKSKTLINSAIGEKSNKSEATNGTAAIIRVQLPLADEVDPVHVTKETVPVAMAAASVARDNISATKKISPVPSDDIFDAGVRKPANVAVKQPIDLFNDEADDLLANTSLQSKGEICLRLGVE